MFNPLKITRKERFKALKKQIKACTTKEQLKACYEYAKKNQRLLTPGQAGLLNEMLLEKINELKEVENGGK
jgi:hypothetical protein